MKFRSAIAIQILSLIYTNIIHNFYKECKNEPSLKNFSYSSSKQLLSNISFQSSISNKGIRTRLFSIASNKEYPFTTHSKAFTLLSISRCSRTSPNDNLHGQLMLLKRRCSFHRSKCVCRYFVIVTLN